MTTVRTSATYAVNMFTTNETLVAGRDLVRLARGRRLHPAIGRALAHVKATHDALAEVANRSEPRDAPRGRPVSGVHGPVLAVRSAFAALAEVLRAHAGLPEGEADGEQARRVYGVLYPEGTSMLTGTAIDLDVECGRVLARAADKPMKAALAALACAAHVRTAAKALGELRETREALAATPALEPGAEPSAFEARAEALGALRDYARAVQIVAELEDSSLARVLLAPLAKIRASQRSAAPTREPEEGEQEMDAREEAAPPSRAA